DYFKSNEVKVEFDGFVQLTEQSVAHEFDKKPVYIGTFAFAEDCELEKITNDMVMLFWSSSNDLFDEYLIKPGIVTLSEANLLRAAAEFLHTQFAFIDRSRYNKYDIYRYMVLNSGILRDLLDYFTSKFYPQTDGSLAFPEALYEDIDNVNSGVFYNDVTAKNILNAVADFLQNVRKSNYYSENKAALAFRLDPKFMDFYGNLDAAYNKSFPSDRPHGVFFFYRKDAVGFQVRFAEIARGGWRTVVPKRGGSKLDEMALFDAANDEIFREGFVLAHTQHLKNKDIYEGGSKMIMLLNAAPSADFKPALWTAQRAVCEAFVSLINYDEKNELKDKNIVDTLGKKEIIEIGPDENMFDDMIVWMGKYADRAGYTLGSGLISGKPDSGINHKEYGVTSFGVYQYLLRTMQELDIDPTAEFSVKIAGGPGGDVAGNMMKLLLAKKADGSLVHPQLKIVAITDGPAVIYDPAGIDREELGKLVLKANLDSFDPAKLQGEGAYMLFSKPVDNEYRLVERRERKNAERMVDRNEYMNIFQNNLYNYADIFMPCGGRPSTLNINNYMDYLPDGKPSSLAIVEGGNSFITPEARIKLQDAGIPIVKDASANKCGVITSSFEILSGLLLEEEEFKQEKAAIVSEVLERLAMLAQGEAEWLFSQHATTGKYLTDLTEELSTTINNKNAEIVEYFTQNPEKLQDKVILSHLPKTLATKYADRISRLPEEYKTVIASVELATRIVYTQTGSLPAEVDCAMAAI
ncbi:MAG: NAD-glutamate dehydrogenase, partial [Lentisphaeria bacterium]|nr:NAD-glutamate dehydrogenase [Lentisphaeria bacterium]